jgi:membrane dipeptidase
MKHASRLILAATLAAATLQAQAPGRKKRTVTDAEVVRVHRSAILIDAHNDIPIATLAGLDIGQPSTDHHTDVPRMKKGGMGGQFFAAYVAPSSVEGNHAANRALQMIDTVRHDIIERHPDDFLFATTAAEVRRARKQHKIAALVGIEGGYAIEDSLRLLRRYYGEGVRYLTLTHAGSHHWADSSGDPNQPNNGLSAFGKEVVLEMNRLGMMVDISHVSDKAFWDALGASKAPIFASHSSCRAISPAPRNLTDEMIAALGKKGGVVQINLACDFLNAEVLAAAAARRGAPPGAGAQPRPRATLADVVKHINHVAGIAGVGAVGLGSDFDGISCAPEGLDGVDKWPNLTRALLEEGYTAAEIRKIYGENTLRLMSEVERVAKSMR